MLEKPLLPAVHGAEVSCMQKRLVGRDTTGRNEFFGHQRVTMDRHALVRRPRAHGVDRIRTGSKSSKPPQASLGLPHAWIDFVRPRTFSRDGKHYLPNPGARLSGSC